MPSDLHNRHRYREKQCSLKEISEFTHMLSVLLFFKINTKAVMFIKWLILVSHLKIMNSDHDINVKQNNSSEKITL